VPSGGCGAVHELCRVLCRTLLCVCITGTVTDHKFCVECLPPACGEQLSCQSNRASIR
jgi:hypothetical protein